MAVRMGHEGTLTAAKAAGAAVAAAALSAGALFASTLASSPPAAAVGSSGKSLTIVTEHVRDVGTVLATQSGLTLYRYTVDPAGQATCTGACAKAWPPLLLPKGVTHIKAPHGVKGLTAVRVKGGRLQVFFHDHALYHFVSDTKKGQDTGQGVENEWFAVLSDGKSSAVTPASSATSTGGAGTGTSTGTSTSAGTSTSPTTTSPSTTKAGNSSTSSATTVPSVTKSTPATSPSPTTTPTTAMPTTAPPTTVPPTTTPPTSPPTTTTTTAPPTGGVGF
jgi:predicted lipoprotein with Yx(FWY)xxD motif